MPVEAGGKPKSAFLIAAFAGTVGGFAFWAVFLYFIFAYPDAQGAIALMISPFCAATFGGLMSVAVWGAVSSSRGKRWTMFLAAPAILLLVLLLSWFVSEIRRM